MLDEFYTIQPVATKTLQQMITKNHVSHAYLIETNGYENAFFFAKALAKTLFCKNIDKQEQITLCHRIDTGNYLDFFVLQPDGSVIKKEQISNLQLEFRKKAVEGEYKIYIIKEADKLNASSANAILKFLEDPEPGIIAILLAESLNHVLPTIISRCQLIKLKNSKVNQSRDWYHQVLQYHFGDFTKIEIFLEQEQGRQLLDHCLSFAFYLEEHKKETLLHLNQVYHNFFTTKEETLLLMDVMTLFYKDLVQLKIGRAVSIFTNYIEKLNFIENYNTIEALQKKIKYLFEIKQKINQNYNQNLIIDQLIFTFEEV